MTSTQKGGWGFLKFVTCLQIPLFLNNRSIAHFCDGGSGRSFVGHFLWTSKMGDLKGNNIKTGNIGNARAMCGICSKLTTIKTPEQGR